MKNWSSGKIAAAIIGGFAFLIALFISLIASIWFLSDVLYKMSGDENYYAEEYEEPKEERSDRERESSGEQEAEEDRESFWEEYEEQNESNIEEEEYYVFANDIKDDLSYQISIEEFYRDDFSEEGGAGTTVVEFTYPVITGDVENLDAINAAIYEEIEEVQEYVASAVPHLSEGDLYTYSGEVYIPYMTEEILSVIYVEYGYFNEGFLESYIRCFNVDMQNGMVMQNTNLLEIDDAFSVEFRERCEKQNGEIDALSYYMDQDITDYLTEENTLIIFYTPLGMEVGFNYYDGWVTVTYQDYEQYKKKF